MANVLLGGFLDVVGVLGVILMTSRQVGIDKLCMQVVSLKYFHFFLCTMDLWTFEIGLGKGGIY